eukprot:PhF_6_TR7859/c0_g1_i2/m.11474
MSRKTLCQSSSSTCQRRARFYRVRLYHTGNACVHPSCSKKWSCAATVSLNSLPDVLYFFTCVTPQDRTCRMQIYHGIFLQQNMKIKQCVLQLRFGNRVI